MSWSRELHYPYTLLKEAIERYSVAAVASQDARDNFLAHIQPLVRHCVGRVATGYGSAMCRDADDIVSYVNTKLIEFWLPAYLRGLKERRVAREAIRYFVVSVRGYTINFVRDTCDLRMIPVASVEEARCTFSKVVQQKVDREEIAEAVDRATREHLALRRRPELVEDVARGVMRYLVLEEYWRTGEVPG